MAALLSIRGGKTMKKKKKYNSQAPQIRLVLDMWLESKK